MVGLKGKGERCFKKCAVCGKTLTRKYFIVGDVKLHGTYFRDDSENAFCSLRCLGDRLKVVTVIV